MAATFVILLVAAALVSSEPAGACSYALTASATFTGTVTKIDEAAGTATFGVDAVESTAQAPKYRDSDPDSPVPLPSASNEFAVRYYPPKQVAELQSGSRYRVTANAEPGSDPQWYSTSLDHFSTGDSMCDSDAVADTTNADGSPIENPAKNFLRRFAASDPRVKGVVVVVPLVLAGAWLVLRRRRRTRRINATTASVA